MSATATIVVIGAGAFGTALATIMALESRSTVTLIGRNTALMSDLRDMRMHDAVLPGVPLADALQFSAEPDAISEAGIVLFAMPSQSHADAARYYGPYLARDAAVVTCAKGLDRTSGSVLTEVLERELRGRSAAALSGPGFAADIGPEPAISRAICAMASRWANRCRRAPATIWWKARSPPRSRQGLAGRMASTCRSPMPSPISSRGSSTCPQPWSA